MVHEMATRGVAMAVLLVVVWTGMVITSTIMENNKGKVVANV